MIAQWRLCYTQLTPLEKKLCFSVIFTCVFLYQRLSNVIVFWHLLYSVKWQIERFVKAGCLCAFSFLFFFFIYLCQCLNHCYSMVNAYVHHEVTMFICPFSLKMFCIQLCQFATMVQIDSIYITMSAYCGWLQSGKARFGLSCCDGMRFF